MSKLKAINGWVICKDVPEEYLGLLEMPEAVKKQVSRICDVISVGPGWDELTKPQFKAGDRVLIAQPGHHILRDHKVNAGTVLEFEGEKYRFVPCQEVIGIIHADTKKKKG